MTKQDATSAKVEGASPLHTFTTDGLDDQVQSENSIGQAIIYCRVSTSKQEEKGTSLDSQAEACIERALSLGYSVGRLTREVWTGTELFERPLLTRDRADIRGSQFKALIVYAVDRLTRDEAHLMILTEECARARCRIIFVTEEEEGSPDGKLMSMDSGYAAETEWQKVRERCLRGRRQRALSGKLHNVGTELYGYRRDKERGTRLIQDEEAVIIRQIFGLILEGTSTRQIIRWLNEKDVPPPSQGKRRFRDGRKAYWGTGAVRRILSDPTYKGEAYAWRWKSRGQGSAVIARPRNEWIRLPDEITPPIVTPEVWEAAQKRIEMKRGAADARCSSNRERPYLLRGYIFCAVCGRRMRGDTERGTYHVYRCSSRHTLSGPCGGKRIPAEACETSLWEEIGGILDRPETMAELKRRRSASAESHSLLVADLEAARREQKRVADELERIKSYESTDNSLWPILEKEMAVKKRVQRRLDAVINIAEARLAAAMVDAARLMVVADYCARGRYADFTFEEKRMVIEALGASIFGSGRDWRLEVAAVEVLK